MRRFGGVCQNEAALAHAGHMIGNAIEHFAHNDLGTRGRHVLVENSSAVRRGENGFGNILADLAGIDIDAENELDIACPVATDPIVNQALRRIVRPVIGNALHQRGGAVTHADHGDLNRLHQLNPFRQTLIVRWSALPL